MFRLVLSTNSYKKRACFNGNDTWNLNQQEDNVNNLSIDPEFTSLINMAMFMTLMAMELTMMLLMLH